MTDFLEAPEKTPEKEEKEAEKFLQEKSYKEERIRKITSLYYSNKEVLKAIFDFSKNREICPRYFEDFGKRPDSFQYPGDIFELVKKGATSFHCSEEIWQDPLKIATGMTEQQLNEQRIGWDLLIDIDSKYIDYSKISAKIIIDVLRFHGIKNIGIKFSVTGDTPVLIRNNNKIALIPISRVIDLIKDGKKLEVLSLNRERKLKFSIVYNFLEHEDIFYEVRHSQSTLPIKLTGHHSVFVWDKGEIIQKKTEEIKKGDFLITYNTKNNPFSSGNLNVKNIFSLNKNQFSDNIFTKDIQITPKLMRLIGYFLAEGHVTNIINQVGFTFNKNEREYIEDVMNLLKIITNKKISIRHPNSGSIQILIHSKEWATFFDAVCGKKRNKHVPDFSWTLPKDLFLEMLKGYIRGDGYKIEKYGIVIKSVSKRLITEMIWLCKLNNISCNLSKEQGKPHKLPRGNIFKGSLVYLLRIPKSELSEIEEFYRERNKFSPFPGDKIFPTDGLIEIYKKIKPKKFISHRLEQVTLRKNKANLNRIRKVLDWFYSFNGVEPDESVRKIYSNYEKLFNSDISLVEVEDISKKEKVKVYDVSVEETEAFFGNYYPILLHNSGSKGFHLIVPWKAFPKEINGLKTSDTFPYYPRIITQYLIEKTKPRLIKKITELTTPNKYIRDFQAPKEVMPDIILVSPRHLFRMPYSLHEKTALASVVLREEELDNFQIKDADPLKITIRDFTPKSRENEAKELLVQALDWYKEQNKEEPLQNQQRQTSSKFQPIKIINPSNSIFPPSIQKILNGLEDGKKRGLFILINFFRSIGLEKDELEKRINEWNEKNRPPLKQGYVKSQVIWSYRNKIVPPPNYDKDYYKGIGIVPTQEEMRYKNPINYISKKYFNDNPKI
ncbi:MAG: LAGLIDADG family homing endonuclease [Nanoarchaeota archaeon]